MTIFSGIFNSVNGDRKYNAWWFAKYFATFIGNGVFPNPSTNLQVMQATNMNVNVRAGSGWIDGYFIFNDSDYNLQLDVADGLLKRIDRVVMRLNYLTRQIEIDVKKGAFSASPVAPTLQRDTDYHELALADIYINNGVTQITQAVITDTRLNKTLCGIVSGTVNQVDTTTLFNQYQSWYEQFTGQKTTEMDEWQAQEKADFDAWFTNIQNILDSSVAGNLLDLININKDNIGDITTLKTTDKSNLVVAINELFTSADNAKKDYSGIIGAPAKPTDTFAVLNNLLKADKANLVANLNLQQQPSNVNETLDALIAKVAKIQVGLKLSPTTAGLSILGESASNQTSQSTQFVRMKELIVNFNGSVRVSFSIKLNSSDSQGCVGKIYVNGLPVGQDRTMGLNTYLTYVEDIVVNEGDRVQIYGKKNNPVGANIVNIKDFTVGVDMSKYGLTNVVL